jgi:aryl-alcohol dehydrogenase-like predicted oxidoreductase
VKLALGTVQFGIEYGISNTLGKTHQQEIKKILNLAKSENITTIDTASAYGNAENELGQCPLSSFNIVSKIPPISNLTSVSDFITETVKQSLRDLNCDALYGLLLHRFEDISQFPVALDCLKQIKANNKVKKVGVSLYSPEQLNDDVLAFADLIQLPLNILDQRFVQSNSLKLLKTAEIEVHTRSTFLQGLLLMQSGTYPDYFKPITPLLEKLTELSNRLNVSKLSLALNYVVNINEVDKVVVGVNNEQQLNEILSCLTTSLSHIDLSDFSLLDERFINPALWQSN